MAQCQSQKLKNNLHISQMEFYYGLLKEAWGVAFEQRTRHLKNETNVHLLTLIAFFLLFSLLLTFLGVRVTSKCETLLLCAVVRNATHLPHNATFTFG